MKVTQLCLTHWDIMDYTYSPWNSPGQNTGVGDWSLLQGIFPTQELNPEKCRDYAKSVNLVVQIQSLFQSFNNDNTLIYFTQIAIKCIIHRYYSWSISLRIMLVPNSSFAIQHSTFHVQCSTLPTFSWLKYLQPKEPSVTTWQLRFHPDSKSAGLGPTNTMGGEGWGWSSTFQE